MSKHKPKISHRERLIIYLLAGAIGGLSLSFVITIAYVRSQPVIHPPLREVGFLPATVSSVIQSGLTIANADQKYYVAPSVLGTWFQPHTRAYLNEEELRPDRKKIESYVKGLEKSVNQPARNAKFTFKDDQLQELTQAQPGQELNVDQTIGHILYAVKHQETKAALAVDQAIPAVTIDKVKELGITKLIGQGESNFEGSPAARAHNIMTGSKVLNGLVLAPGEEFSFNESVGTVDDTTGYRAELVIKGDKLIPEYGGGLCQVSTTLFRAAMASGLPIIERHAHSFPVRYYNPQGYDAAIYPGVIDFRFKNDTQGHVLLQTHVVGSKIRFELYGTSDDRKVSITGPSQYEIQPDGAMKAVVSRTVTYTDGTEDKKSFYSNYKAPSSFTTVRNPLE